MHKKNICHGNHCMVTGTLPEMNGNEHSSPFHPQMQFKAQSCKDEDISEHEPKLI